MQSEKVHFPDGSVRDVMPRAWNIVDFQRMSDGPAPAPAPSRKPIFYIRGYRVAEAIDGSFHAIEDPEVK